MQDIATLRQRIEQAASGLDSAEIMRRDRNTTLGDTLAKVEERFNARRLELGYLSERINELEVANRDLTGAIEAFSTMIQAESEDQIESALFRATAGARELVAAMQNGTLSQMTLPVSARFEDVTADELAAEELASPPWEEIDIPEAAPVAETSETEASLSELLDRLQRRAA